MFKLAHLFFVIGALVACERPNRSVEIMPSPKDGKGGDGIGDDGDGKGDDSKSEKGSIVLTLTGFPATATSAEVTITGGIKLITETVSLSSGSGTVKAFQSTVGSTTIKVGAKVENLDYSGSVTTTVSKGKTAKETVAMKTGVISGDSSVDVKIDVGGTPSTTPGTDPVTPTGPGLWDGKSFQGNSQFNVEAVK